VCGIFAKELNLAGRSSFLGVTFLTVLWLLLWQVTSLIWAFPYSSPFDALRETLELVSYGLRTDITTSLLEVVGGIFIGGSLAVAISTILDRSEKVRSVVIDLLPIAYISPIALWLLVFLFVDWLKVNHSLGYGHKIIGIGLLTFFPFVQALWGFRDQSSLYRVLVAIDHALPVAFVAMLFGELYASTAGLGFLMVVASATYQYQKGLAGFLIMVVLFVILSSVIRLTAKRTRHWTHSST
jgi:ABC-type nitrate/sulfonate/bicarbonate transport system permease component